MSATSSINSRLLKELKTFQNNPISNCGILPREDNFRLWDCVLGVSAIINEKAHDFPLHLLVHFPDGYPIVAPNVGFSTKFPYHDGASYVINDISNPLNGKFVICLNVLGNFAGVHGEWKHEKGSGWSPAYDISSLFIVLQTVIQENLSKCSVMELEQTIKACRDYENSNPMPQISKLENDTENEVSNDSSLGIDFSTCKIRLPSTVQDLCSTLSASMTNQEQKHALSQILRYLLNDEQIDHSLHLPGAADAIETDITCWYSRANYKEDILGYGIKLDVTGRAPRLNYELTTDGNYISKSAYEQSQTWQM